MRHASGSRSPKLVIILGAGASFDVCPEDGPIKNPDWKPPIVSNLFESGALDETLGRFPEAQTMMSRIRTQVRNKGGRVFEDTIRRHMDDADPYIRRQMVHVPIALYSHFETVSRQYTREP